jgi:hypothetical protein
MHQRWSRLTQPGGWRAGRQPVSQPFAAIDQLPEASASGSALRPPVAKA